MAAPLCEIVFDNDWDTFYSGSVITGHVKINLVKEKKVRSIAIRFVGEAKTEWSERVSYVGGDRKRRWSTEWLSGHENYLTLKRYLVGGSGSTITLLPGEYVYPFSCAIPSTAPSSFEGELGHIRYMAEVKLDRPWKFDQGLKMPFNVIAPLDLNYNPALREPGNLTLEKRFCCLFCRSGPLTVVVHLPATGFVPGQIVPIVVDVDNISNVDVERICISLRRYTIFKTTMPRHAVKKASDTLAEVPLGAVNKGTSRNQSVDATVPKIPPSDLIHCNLIELEYKLKIECFVAGFHLDLQGKIPVVIGTVPLVMGNVLPLPSVDASIQPSAPPIVPPPAMGFVPPVVPGFAPSSLPQVVPSSVPSYAPYVPPSFPPTAPFPEPTGDPPMPWNFDPNAPPPSYEESMKQGDIADRSDSEHMSLLNGRLPVLPVIQQQKPMNSKPS